MTKALRTMVLTGLLTAPALVTFAQQQPAQPPAQQQRPSAEDVFASLDSDSDGKLTEEEFSKAFTSQATEEDKKKMFTEWDVNGDATISKQEFLAKY